MDFVIEDWAGNVMFNGQRFATFEEAWAHIYANVPEEDWEDLYVVNDD